jgi:hypothetical protein
MNGTAKKWVAIGGGVLFAVAGILMKWSAMPGHLHPVLHDDMELVLMALGAIGITAPISIMNPAPQDKP